MFRRRFLELMVAGAVCLGGGLARGDAGEATVAHAGSLTPLREGSWTLLSGRVINHADQEVHAALALNEARTANVQYSAPVWLPANSILQLPVPFRATGANNYEVEMDVTLLDTSTGGDRVLHHEEQPLAFNDDGDFPTALYGAVNQDSPINLVTRIRGFEHRKGRESVFDSRKRPFPSSVLGLLSFSDMVVSTPDTLSGAQAQAVREWLCLGGHLWIMADRVSPETMRLILGDEWQGEFAGETELTRVVVEGNKSVIERPSRVVETPVEPSRATALPLNGRNSRKPAKSSSPVELPKALPQEEVRYDEPIRMVRMIAPGMEVTGRIEKWPAILWRPVGKGTLLVTTFDIPAMNFAEDREIPAWLGELTDRFLTPPRTPPPALLEAAGELRQGSAQGAMDLLGTSIVGHDVVGREPVLVILGSLCGLLLLVGWQLQRKQRLEFLAPAAVVISLVATAAMLFLGAKSKGTTPLTLANMNEGHLVPAANCLTYRGAVDVYSPSVFDGSLAAPPGSWIEPELESQRGHIVRMSWAVLAPMRWDYLHFPSATLRAAVAGTISQPGNLTVTGTFGPRGFVGELQGQALADGKETILSGPGGRMAPQFQSPTQFTAEPDDELAEGDWAGSGVITANRAHRLTAMKSALAYVPRQSAMLYTWVAIDPGVHVTGEEATTPERQILTLAEVPVTIRRPEAGSTFLVPGPFLRVSNFRMPGASSPVYDERGEKFLGSVSGSVTGLLRFELPAALMSMHVDHAVLKVDMVAADRSVRIVALRPGGKSPRDFKNLLVREEGTMSPLTVEMTGDADTQPDAQGGIVLGLDVGMGKDPTSPPWELKNMELTLTGHIVGESPAATNVHSK